MININYPTGIVSSALMKKSNHVHFHHFTFMVDIGLGKVWVFFFFLIFNCSLFFQF